MRVLVLMGVFWGLRLWAGTSVYFSEEDDLSKEFVAQVQREQTSIRMACHRISEVKVIDSLVAAHGRGVLVEVIVDPLTVTKKTPLKLLVDAGVPVYVWKFGDEKKGKSQHMHHSFSVFGKECAWSGTYSFSLKRLYQHREGALVLQDEKVAAAFLTEFDKIKKKQSISFEEYLIEKGGREL